MYARGYFMREGRFRPYGLLGYGQGSATLRVNQADSSQSDSGLSYGLGAEYGVPGFSVTVEYVSLFDDEAAMNALHLGFLTRF